MLDYFKSHLASIIPKKESKFLVACSGGVDSMALVSLCKKSSLNFSVAHINYGLRNHESDADENCVANWCEENKIELFQTKLNTLEYIKELHVGIQEGARVFRYNWLNEICQKNKFDYILTAHHLDDVKETFFINLIRGSGIKGLSSRLSRSGNVVRPLSEISKEAIIKYAAENNILYRNDESNFKIDYLRNKIRNIILPHLYDADERANQNLESSIKNLNADFQLLKNLVESQRNNLFTKKNDLVILALDKLNLFPPQGLLIYYLLDFLGCPIQIAIQIWESFESHKTGAIFFVEEKTLEINRNQLLIYTTHSSFSSESVVLPFDKNELTFSLNIPLKLSAEILEKNEILLLDIDDRIVYLALDEMKFPLSLRKWKNGDAFHPFGMHGKKKLSDFFTDLKLSKLEKEKIWLLCDSQDKIVWIIDQRIDENYRITDKTTKVLRLEHHLPK